MAERLNVTKVREEKGITQAELARRLGMERQYVGQIETRRRSPTLKTVFRIARALGCKTAMLIEESGGKRA